MKLNILKETFMIEFLEQAPDGRFFFLPKADKTRQVGLLEKVQGCLLEDDCFHLEKTSYYFSSSVPDSVLSWRLGERRDPDLSNLLRMWWETGSVQSSLYLSSVLPCASVIAECIDLRLPLFSACNGHFNLFSFRTPFQGNLNLCSRAYITHSHSG